jgi:hypothetical protein
MINLRDLAAEAGVHEIDLRARLNAEGLLAAHGVDGQVRAVARKMRQERERSD